MSLTVAAAISGSLSTQTATTFDESCGSMDTCSCSCWHWCRRCCPSSPRGSAGCPSAWPPGSWPSGPVSPALPGCTRHIGAFRAPRSRDLGRIRSRCPRSALSDAPVPMTMPPTLPWSPLYAPQMNVRRRFRLCGLRWTPKPGKVQGIEKTCRLNPAVSNFLDPTRDGFPHPEIPPSPAQIARPSRSLKPSAPLPPAQLLVMMQTWNQACQ